MIAHSPLQLAGAATKAERVSAPVEPAARLARWLSARHSLAVEAVSLLVLYATYEAARGLVEEVGNCVCDARLRCRR